MKKLISIFLLCAIPSLLSASELKIKYALKLGMIRGKTIMEKFQLAKEVGYDGIEISAPGVNLDEVKAAMKATGLPVHGVVCSTHWKFNIGDSNPDIRAKSVKGLEDAIRAAKEVGASTVLLVPGKVTNQVDYKTCWKNSIPEIKKVLPLAKELGIKVILENVWNNFLTTPEETLRYIKELDSDMVGAYFDIGNTVRYSAPATWIPVLSKHIIKLDVKDYKRQPEGKNLYNGFRTKIGEGDSDWVKVCAELKKISYEGWTTAEVRGGDKKRIAEILAAMKKAFSY